MSKDLFIILLIMWQPLGDTVIQNMGIVLNRFRAAVGSVFNLTGSLAIGGEDVFPRTTELYCPFLRNR